MSLKTSVPIYSIKEEIANSITHGVGLILAIAGLGILIAFASRLGNAWHVVSCSIFATTLILLVYLHNLILQHDSKKFL